MQREKYSALEGDGTNGKPTLKPIIYFQSWRVGKVWSSCNKFYIGLFGVSFDWAMSNVLSFIFRHSDFHSRKLL